MSAATPYHAFVDSERPHRLPVPAPCVRGRYVSPDEAAMERAWNVIHAPNPLRIVYNAASTMMLPVIRMHDGQPEMCAMQWGLIPPWWSNAQMPRSTLNARVEDAAAKPMWRSAVKRTRCLVPNLGWYQWKDPGAGRAKQPYLVHQPGRQLLHFAGLWSSYATSSDCPPSVQHFFGAGFGSCPERPFASTARLGNGARARCMSGLGTGGDEPALAQPPRVSPVMTGDMRMQPGRQAFVRGPLRSARRRFDDTLAQ